MRKDFNLLHVSKSGNHHLYSVRVGSACSLDSVTKAASAGVDVKGVLHQACFTTKEHHVKRCVPSRRNYLEIKEVMTWERVED